MATAVETSSQHEVANSRANDIVRDIRGDKRGEGSVAQDQASFALRSLCLLVTFFVRCEVSVLTLVIPHIAIEFDCSLELAAWCVYAPNFAATMSAPSLGKLADMCGASAVWQSSLFLIILSTWLAAWSPALWLLFIARAMTGIAHSGIFAPSLALMSKGLDPTRRGVMSSHLMTADTLGSSVGMLAGGMIIERVAWRWIFLMPAPFMTLAWVSSLVIVRKPHMRSNVSSTLSLADFDWLGTLFFASASFCLLFALNRGNDSGWDSPVVIGAFVLSLLLTPLLVLTEVRAAHPILPVWLFAGRAKGLLLFTLTTLGAGYSSSFLLVPVYMQDALEIPPGRIGQLLAARPICAFLTSFAMARILASDCVRRLTLARTGAVVVATSYSLLSVVAAIRGSGTFYAVLEVQLMLQATGHFITSQASNAILVAMMPEKQLANSAAMQRVAGTSGGLLVSTICLSTVRAAGSEMDPECYQATWVILLCVGLTVGMATCVVPASADQSYTSLVEERPAKKMKRPSVGEDEDIHEKTVLSAAHESNAVGIGNFDDEIVLKVPDDISGVAGEKRPTAHFAKS